MRTIYQRYICAESAWQKVKRSEKENAVLYVYGASGFGKTELIRQYYRNKKIVYYSCMEGLWNTDELLSMRENSDSQSPCAVVIDDLHMLWDEEKRAEIVSLTARNDVQVILISRSPIPRWLMDAHISNPFMIVQEDDLRLTIDAVSKFYADCGYETEESFIKKVVLQTEGSPYLIRHIAACLMNGESPEKVLSGSVREKYVESLRTKVLAWLPADVLSFLLKISIVDSFDIGLAKNVTGDANVEAVIGRCWESGNYMTKSDGIFKIRYPILMALRCHRKATYSPVESNALYNRAALYFETIGEEGKAFEFYAKSENIVQIREMLIRNSRSCPESGYYFEMRKYYLMLKEKDIEQENCLMASMSMLYSMMLNVEKSEYWYQKLKQRYGYAEAEEKRELTARISYLDIGLPHRGSMDVLKLIKSGYSIMREKSIPFPKLSVTSNLPSVMNGGKDFCNWSKKDREIARTAGTILSAFLGSHGKGIVNLALAESLHEKGSNSSEVLQLLTRAELEIHSEAGNYTMLFVVNAIKSREFFIHYSLEEAKGVLEKFRLNTMQTPKADKLLANIDAMLCRYSMCEGDLTAVQYWLWNQAPDEDEFFTLNRYQFLTKVRCYILMEQYASAMMLIEKLRYYAALCDRKYIDMELSLLTAIIQYRQHEEWQKPFIEALKGIQEYDFIRIISREGAAIQPLLTEVSKTMLSNAKYAQWFTRVKDETDSIAVRYPLYLHHKAVQAPALSERDIKILKLLAQGMTQKKIAEQLDLTPRNVKYFSENIYHLMGVNNKTDAVLVAKSLNLI